MKSFVCVYCELDVWGSMLYLARSLNLIERIIAQPLPLVVILLIILESSLSLTFWHFAPHLHTGYFFKVILP